jgi:nicotinamidase-related amidase
VKCNQSIPWEKETIAAASTKSIRKVSGAVSDAKHYQLHVAHTKVDHLGDGDIFRNLQAGSVA